jgi:hypothetical protein
MRDSTHRQWNERGGAINRSGLDRTERRGGEENGRDKRIANEQTGGMNE